ISARCGTLRIICTELSSRRSPHVDRPVIKPSARPRPPPMAKPMPARQPLIARCVLISPLLISAQPAATTALGAGRMRVDSRPKATASCQAVSSASGKAQGARRRARLLIALTLISYLEISTQHTYRMGGAQRYPSAAAHCDGYRRLNPSYECHQLPEAALGRRSVEII